MAITPIKSIFPLFFILVILSGCASDVTPKEDYDKEVKLTESQDPTHQSTTIIWEKTLKNQINNSTKILFGRVVNVVTKKDINEMGDTIFYSVVTLQVLETLKGTHSDKFIFKSLGGVENGLLHSYSVSPIFATGETAIVFIDRNIEQPLIPLGWSFAKLVVKNDILLPSSVELATFRKWIKD
ncbi:hypothetical protein KKA47_01660 [bacterium]|nr:hypothetical protein [bacterium]